MGGTTAPSSASRFTREELEAADPERGPSVRRRWLIGLGMGAFGALYSGFPLGVVALPFAFTAPGAGTLFGSGIVVLASLAFDAVVWQNGDLGALDVPAFVAWTLAGLVALVAGIIGTAVVMRRPERPAVA